MVTVQVALYPIGQGDWRAVDAAIGALRKEGLEVRVGSMHSEVSGDAVVVFAALGREFEAAADFGGAVMHVTASNACPA